MSKHDEIQDGGRDMNRDPITKAPGAHPVGVGVGGAAGGDMDGPPVVKGAAGEVGHLTAPEVRPW